MVIVHRIQARISCADLYATNAFTPQSIAAVRRWRVTSSTSVHDPSRIHKDAINMGRGLAALEGLCRHTRSSSCSPLKVCNRIISEDIHYCQRFSSVQKQS